MKSRRKPPTITVPEHATGLVEQFLDAAQRLTSSVVLPDDHEWTRSYDLVGVRPGDRLPLRRGLVVDVIACDPCVGYIFSKVTDKLKAEHRGRPGAELAELRRAGVAVTEAVEAPLLAFLGDTTPRVYETHPELLDCAVVVGECTFLDPEHRAGAWKRKHTHWDDLKPIIAANPQTHFVVTHFSLRYTTDRIRSFFDGERLENMVPWVADGDVR
jgi:ribonuclease Z